MPTPSWIACSRPATPWPPRTPTSTAAAPAAEPPSSSSAPPRRSRSASSWPWPWPAMSSTSSRPRPGVPSCCWSPRAGSASAAGTRCWGSTPTWRTWPRPSTWPSEGDIRLFHWYGPGRSAADSSPPACWRICASPCPRPRSAS